MAQYTPIFEKPYENGYENLPSQTTPITAETLNDKDDAIVNIESYLSQNDIPTYEEHTNTSGEFKTLSGGILSSCVVNLELIQSGSGTPSPQNVRPITGHTAVEVDVTDADSNTTQYTVALGQTVYGGSLDVVSGVLTVTHAHVDLGSYTWYKTNANLFYAEYPRDFKKAVYASGYWYANGVCECYKFIQNTITSEDGVINLYFEEARSFYRMFVNDSSRYSLSASDFKTAVTGQYLVYELATPITIQLTPQQINTLIGENHLDVPLEGQSLDSAVYRELFAWDDVERAVAVKLDLSSVAPIEYTDKASQSYNQKQLFIKDNRLCQAQTAISSGASFTENTNFKYTTLAEIIEPLIP